MQRGWRLFGLIVVGLVLNGCGEMTVVHDTAEPEPPAASQEQTLTGAVSPQDAKPIELGIKYRVMLDAAEPTLKKQYFKLHLDANTPIAQRLKVVNIRPGKVTFTGRCTLYERNAIDEYTLSVLKLGGAWKAEGEGGAQFTRVDVFATKDIIFEAAVDSGAGYFEIDLEKYY
jgi:hypothetical protein